MEMKRVGSLERCERCGLYTFYYFISIRKGMRVCEECAEEMQEEEERRAK